MLIKAKVEIEGLKPFLHHAFPINALSGTKSKGGSTGNNESEWKDTVRMDANRKLYVQDICVKNSIAAGGKEIKVGRGNIYNKVLSTLDVVDTDNGKIYTGLHCPEEPSSLDHLPVYLDMRPVINPMTKGRNLRYRIAMKAGWKITFVLQWDDRIASTDQIRMCVENAGMFQGLGDGRKLGFGRFKLISFEKLK